MIFYSTVEVKYLFSMLAVPVDFLHRDNLVPDWFAADTKVNIPSISPEMLDTTIHYHIALKALSSEMDPAEIRLIR